MIIKSKKYNGVILLLLITYLLATNTVLHPVLEYIVDYQTIVNEKCENRTVPESDCNGKCYLKDQIVKLVQTEEDPIDKFVQIPKKMNVDPHLYYTENPSFYTLQSLECFLDMHIIELLDHLDIDRPPEC